MGGWQALAITSLAGSLGESQPPPAGRAVLRGAICSSRADARESAGQRYQSTSDQLLSLAQTWAFGGHSLFQFEDLLLRTPPPLELALNGGAKTAEAAALFYYLNRTGYNGLCRFNQSGEFNVPFGRHKKLTYRSEFREYAPIFRRWQFKAIDFGRLRIDESDFIYADPPYDVEFTKYWNGFDWEEQVRVAEWLAGHPGPVVLANQATPRIVALYESLGFDLMRLAGPRRISCNGDRTPADEVLALRNLQPG